MEYFVRTKYVRLKSLHNKYLVVTKDGVSVKQNRNGNVIQAYWAVEMVDNRPGLIRLRSCHGKFLTASNEPFLLGWTGNKVMQTLGTENDPSVLWEPKTVADLTFFIRLRTPLYDKYLRANGGTPPWRKSVTVDVPGSAVTQDWNMWLVDTLDDHGIAIGAGAGLCSWPRNSESDDSWQESDQTVSTGGSSPASSYASSPLTYKSGILDIHIAKTIRLVSNHDRYLVAQDDGESIHQSKHGRSKQAYWTVEHIRTIQCGSLVRLKSTYQKYLTATGDNFLLGATGKKVKQTVPKGLDYSIEWELIRDGKKVKLKTWDGNYLRANGGVPPWRNSVTHDILPSRGPTKDKVLWDVEVFDVYDDDDD